MRLARQFSGNTMRAFWIHVAAILRGKRYKITAWMFPYILCMILISTAAHAATYYVSTSGNDSNPGTSNSRWRTITKCAAVMVAGDTCVIGNGTYNESNITPTAGTNGNPITFLAENKWLAILNMVGTCAHGFNFNGNVSYVTLDGVKIQVDASYVCNPAGSTPPAMVKGLGAQTPRISGPATTGNCCIIVRNVYVAYSTKVQLGIKINQDNSEIAFSEVHNSIETLNSVNMIMHDNELFENDIFGSTVTSKGGARNVQVYRNIIHITQGQADGLVLGGTSGAGNFWDEANPFECYNCIAYNNVVINEAGGNGYLYATAGCKDCSFFNNVGINGVYFSRVGGSTHMLSTNTIWKNNIFKCAGQDAAANFTGSTGHVFDYNDFFQCVGTQAQAHPISGDPLFVNSASDWHLNTGSPAIDAGTPITNIARYGGGTFSGLNLTMDRVLRPVGSNWDLGVYESGANDTAPPSAPKNLRVL